jgi:hypothetical protein
LRGPGVDLKVDFDIRLDRAIRRLEEAPTGKTLEDERSNIVEALYATTLSELERMLGGRWPHAHASLS